jgi:hypothetical protein
MKSKANKKKRPMPVGSGDLLGGMNTSMNHRNWLCRPCPTFGANECIKFLSFAKWSIFAANVAKLGNLSRLSAWTNRATILTREPNSLALCISTPKNNQP